MPKDKDAAEKPDLIELIEAIPYPPALSTRAQVKAALDEYDHQTDAVKQLIKDYDGGLFYKKLIDTEYYWEKSDAEALKVKLSSVKAKKGKKVEVKWKKNPAADGYRICYKAKGTKVKTVDINNAKTLKKTVNKLKANKKYAFRVCTFKKVYNPSKGKIEKVCGIMSNPMKVKTRK